MAARQPSWKLLLPLFPENYWTYLDQTLHTSFPYGLVVQRTFSSHWHTKYGGQAAILKIVVIAIPRKLLNISWLYIQHPPMDLLCSACFHLICLLNMAARQPSWKLLLPLFPENYWTYLDQTLHTSFPYGLVVQRTFSSHWHTKYGGQAAILKIVVIAIPRKLLNISWLYIQHPPMDLLCSACFHLICLLNMAARQPSWKLLLLLFPENYWTELHQT